MRSAVGLSHIGEADRIILVMTEQLELLCILTLRGVLFGVITSGSAIEREEFVSMVLTTFRLFASGQNLADTLYFRYTEQRPEWLTRKGKVDRKSVV